MSEERKINQLRGKKSLFLHFALNRLTGSIIKVLGDPGIGKTEIVKTVGDLGVENLPPDIDPDTLPEGWKPDIFSIYVSQHDNVEFMMPFLNPETGEYSLVPSPLLTRLTLGCWMIYDECTLEGMQESMLQQCSGKRISMGHWVGPRGVTRIMIGNKAENANFSYVHNAILGNRLREYEWEPLPEEWMEDFALPYGIHPIIGCGVKVNPTQLFLDFDPNRTRNNTPRSITGASDDLLAAEKFFGNVAVPNHVVAEVLAGRMPDASVREFMALHAIMDKVVPYSTIISDPDGAPIPANPSARFMTNINVARRCDEQDWEQVYGYAQRLPIEDRCGVIEPILKRHKNLYATPQGQAYQADKSTLVAA